MDIIRQLENSEKFAAIDRHFATFIFKLTDYADPVLALSAALVSRSTREGDVCVDLNKYADGVNDSPGSAEDHLKYPHIQNWRQSLQTSTVVGAPGEFKPLILDHENRLYLHRYWQYENSLARSIQIRIKHGAEGVAPADLYHILADIFPESPGSGADWQKIAAAVAAVKNLCVISGGPGTGKSYTVARILATLIKQAQPNKLRIALTAPTGKAAARLAESVQAAKTGLKADSGITASIPMTSYTIHRLLKPIKGTPSFRYNSENPLPVDVIVVDEASMVDLPLMSKLMQALTIETRIVLMGDRHQLASVQAGSILGDICGRKQANGYSQGFALSLSSTTGISAEKLQAPVPITSDIHDNLVYFTHNYRFGEKIGISRLSEAVNFGNSDMVIDILQSNHYPEITWIPMESLKDQQVFLSHQIQTHYSRLNRIVNPEKGHDALNRFRILCAVNRGFLGVDRLNELSGMTVQNAGQSEAMEPLQEWYNGRPILITANNYELDLFNGDVGIALHQATGKTHFQIYFAEGSSGNMRMFTPDRLPQHQSVYAMTIHKSQGSEFDEVLLVLPDQDLPLLTRELLYTGITRAKRNLSILASESVIRSAVSRRIERTSGLRDALWN